MSGVDKEKETFLIEHCCDVKGRNHYALRRSLYSRNVQNLDEHDLYQSIRHLRKGLEDDQSGTLELTVEANLVRLKAIAR